MRIELDILFAVEIGILVQQACTELLTEHVLHGTLQHLGLHQSLVDGLLQILVVGTVWEVHIITPIDCHCRLLHNSSGSRLFTVHFSLFTFQRQLVYGSIVAHHYPVETHIIAQNILQYPTVRYTLRIMNGMIARHHHLAARQSDHRLVGQQYLFHQHLLFGITAAAIAQVVLRTGTHALLQVVLLQTLHKGHTHRCRQVAILAIRLFQTVERGDAAHVDHRREGQHTAHLTQGGTGLDGFLFCQFRIKRAGLTNLLRIDGRAQGVHTREHLLVQEGRNTVGRVLYQPLLHGCRTVAQLVGVSGLLHTELREVSDAVGNQFAALRLVQLPLLVEQFIHIHTPQLGNALFLRHLVVEFINLLLHIRCSAASC